MNNFVWHNPYLPQTLKISVFFAYAHGIFAVLGLTLTGVPYLELFFSRILPAYTPFGLLLIALGVLGGFGIANLRFWGYFTLLPVAVLTLLSLNGLVNRPEIPFKYSEAYFDLIFSKANLISLIFDIAIIALLLHPESWKFVKNRFEKTFP